MFLTEELNRRVTALKKSRLEAKEAFFNLVQIYNDRILRDTSDKLFILLNKKLITAESAARFILAQRESFVEFIECNNFNHQIQNYS